MYASGMFNVQQMQMWEKQPEFDKTWKDAKEYFEELVDSIETYKLATQPEIIRYMHVVAGFSTKATWIKAIRRGNYRTWPGLMVEMVTKNFPKSEKRIKGHNRKIKAGLRSTKVKRSKNGKPEQGGQLNKSKEKRNLHQVSRSQRGTPQQNLFGPDRHISIQVKPENEICDGGA